uniref:L-serine deaminase n=1 Tax=Sphenodon punctatus TaxID=8508 RepID=A0A8D0HCK5_SPHPU
MEALLGEAGRCFHIITPVIESKALSKAAGTRVYMKLDNIQPTGSFKIRGIGYFCQEVSSKCAGSLERHLFTGRGRGNAGLAAAYAAKKLGIPITIIVPTSWAAPAPLENSSCFLFCQAWDDAKERAQALAEAKGWEIIHPFDHPLVWKGHASLVRELRDSLDAKPGAIVLAVGGGGLLAGVVAGLKEVGWLDVPIVAAETHGADSFNASVKAGRLVTLMSITSVATCLGARTVAPRALECASECPILSEVLEDVEAVEAVEQFLDDERMLVEPACGASLAVLYSGHIQRLQREGRLRPDLDSIVIIVCGGSAIHMAELQALKSQLGMK